MAMCEPSCRGHCVVISIVLLLASNLVYVFSFAAIGDQSSKLQVPLMASWLVNGAQHCPISCGLTLKVYLRLSSKLRLQKQSNWPELCRSTRHSCSTHAYALAHATQSQSAVPTQPVRKTLPPLLLLLRIKLTTHIIHAVIECVARISLHSCVRFLQLSARISGHTKSTTAIQSNRLMKPVATMANRRRTIHQIKEGDIPSRPRSQPLVDLEVLRMT